MVHQLLIWRLILVLCVARVARLQSTLNAESSDYDQRSNFLLELKELVDQLGSEMRRMSQEARPQPCVTDSTNYITEFRRQHEEMKTELQQTKDLLQQLLSQQMNQTVDNGSIDLTQRPLAMCEDLVAEFRRQNDDMKTELQHVKDLLQFQTSQLEQNADNVSIELTKLPLVIDGLTSGDDESVVTPASSTVAGKTTLPVTLTTSPAGTTTTPATSTTTATTTTTLATTKMETTPGTPILVHTLDGTTRVYAIATLGDRLFVSRGGVSQVSVYDTTSFQLQHQLTFSGLGRYIDGLATCSTHNYLYISDFVNDCIHRVSISSAGAMISTRIKWDVVNPYGLSVNSARNVLVVCGHAGHHRHLYRIVREYTPTGSLVREISDSNRLFQAVGLSNGMWAVSRFGPIHGVIVVSVNGSTRVEHSYGNEEGSGTGQMHYARGLTVDEHGYIIVADALNHRVLVFNPTLTDVRQLPLPLGTELRYPNALVLDQSRGRLYVGESGYSINNRLLVFNAVTNVGALCKQVKCYKLA